MYDPISVVRRLRNNTIAYMETAFRIRDDDENAKRIAIERGQLLRNDRSFSLDPLIEPIPRYSRIDWEMDQLAATPSALPGFNETERQAAMALLSAGLLPPSAKPYIHQARLLARGVQPGKPGIVASGTGSGKTESFLMPVLATIMREATRWPRPQSGYLGGQWWRTKLDKSGKWKNGLGPPPKATTPAEALRDPFTGAHQRVGEAPGRPQAVRAMIIYPMNALVEDQMVRLRRALASAESTAALNDHANGNRIFFGRLTGQTPIPGWRVSPGEQRRALVDAAKVGRGRHRRYARFRKAVYGIKRDMDIARLSCGVQTDQAPSTVDSNHDNSFRFPAVDGAEIITRWDMQEAPPDLLITNMSMLNALLTREVDAPIIEKTRDWLLGNDDAYFFLVLDELHLHRGSAGAEIAGLLRVLIQRLGLDQPSHRHKLRILCSSASLPMDGALGARSSEYLYDLFGRAGHWTPGGAEPQCDPVIWSGPGVVETGRPIAPQAGTSLEVDPAPFRAFRNHSASLPGWRTTAGGSGDEDALTIIPEIDAAEISRLVGPQLSAIGGALGLPATASPEDIIVRLGDALEMACSNGAAPRATKSQIIAQRLFGKDVDGDGTALEGALLARGLGDRLKIESAASFRVHAFQRSIDGLFGTFSADSSGKAILADLDVEAAWERTVDGESRRPFELLYCEQCGEVFFGGRRAIRVSEDPTPAMVELCPVDADADKAPETATTQRFEDLTYDEFAVIWPRIRTAPLNPVDMIDPYRWDPVWLDSTTGQVVTKIADPMNPKPRPASAFEASLLVWNGVDKQHKRTASGKGTSVPYCCPACGTDYSNKRDKNARLSPIRNFRPGFGRTTQLLASEIFAIQKRLDGDKAKTIVFADSRQDAASSSTGIQRGHGQDAIRQLLIELLREQHQTIQTMRTSTLPGLKARFAEFEEDRQRTKSDAVRKTLSDEIRKIQSEIADIVTDVIPLARVLERCWRDPQGREWLSTARAGEPVQPLIARCYDLGIHPADPVGAKQYKFNDPERRPWHAFIVRDDLGVIRWVMDPDQSRREFLERSVAKLIEGCHRNVNSVLFGRLYFGLEDAGLGYVTVQESPDPAIQVQDLREAAMLRMLADHYLIDMDQWESKNPIQEWSAPADVSHKRRLKKTLELIFGAASYAKDAYDLADRLSRRQPLGKVPGCYHYRGKPIQSAVYIRVSSDTDPYWRCSRCGRVHLHLGVGACTRCGTRLDAGKTRPVSELWPHHFLARRIQRGEGAFRLHTEELTGQTADYTGRQREFLGVFTDAEDQRIRQHLTIDALSVTTTMEVGIDIGSLRSIVQANMPPQRFNYQQRVGRAGRRRQAFAMAFTICRSKSHDLHYFRHPEQITGDPPPPPFITTGQSQIPQRLLRKFWLIDAFKRIRDSARATPAGWPGDDLVKQDIHGEFLERVGWGASPWKAQLREVLHGADSHSVRDSLVRALKSDARVDVAIDLNADSLLADLDRAASSTSSVGLAESMADSGFFPMFGMPTRIRDLFLGRFEDDEENEWQSMDRDLDLAIVEFSPGQVLQRDKRLFRCIGFVAPLDEPVYDRSNSEYRGSDSDPFSERRVIYRCRTCGAWNIAASAIATGDWDPPLPAFPEPCSVCATRPESEDQRLAVTPAGFRTDFEYHHPDDDLRDESTSRIVSALAASSVTPVPIAGTNIELGRQEDAHTLRINTNVKDEGAGPQPVGFELNRCETALDGVRIAQNVIDSAWMASIGALSTRERVGIQSRAFPSWSGGATGRLGTTLPIKGPFIFSSKPTSALAVLMSGIPDWFAGRHLPFLTHGTTDPERARWAGLRAAAISASYLIVYAASREMDIDPDEIEVLEPLIRRNGADQPALHFADRAANGSGYCDFLGKGDVPLIATIIKQLVAGTDDKWLADVKSAQHLASCRKSCYKCLMRYGNMAWHSTLDWRLGMDWLALLADLNWKPSPADWWRPDPDGDLKRVAETAQRRLLGREITAGAYGPCLVLEKRGSRPETRIQIVHPFCEVPTKLQPFDQVWDSFNMDRRPLLVRQWIKD